MSPSTRDRPRAASGRVALITGAAGGIGRATVHAFATAGWMVAGSDRDGAAPPETHWFFRADLVSPEAIRTLVADVARTAGRLDAVVNNAAVQMVKPAVDTAVAEWDETIATNARAPFLLAVAALPLLRAVGGSIVNVSSVHAVATAPGFASYAASKGALAALTRALAIEFASAGVRVNAVLPGAVDTPMLRAGLARGGHPATPAALRGLASRTVIGRIGIPAEIAQAILFLADADRSSFVTGQVLVVDGGATIQLSTDAVDASGPE